MHRQPVRQGTAAEQHPSGPVAKAPDGVRPCGVTNYLLGCEPPAIEAERLQVEEDAQLDRIELEGVRAVAAVR